MYKASELVTFVHSMLGMPYWYGTCVYKCSESRLKSKTKQYPSHYGSSRTATYKKHIAKKLISMDCVGMIKGFFWTDGGKGVVEAIGNDKTFASKYGGNGCPDKSADGMLRWCKSQGCKNGKISTLPDVPGVLVFSPGHVGVYVGNGYAVEARGFAYGVVKTKVANRKWTDWAYLPASLIDYGDAATVVIPESKPQATYKLGDRLLKRKSPIMTGDDVKELQTSLNAFGFDCGAIDGEYGKATEKGVKAFQTAAKIEVDGEFGSKSYAALKAFKDESEYIAQSGDSLWKIAEKLLGDGSRYPEIIKLNALTTDVIRVGQVLKFRISKTLSDALKRH